MAIGFILSGVLKSKFRKYSPVPLSNGMSGAAAGRPTGAALLASASLFKFN